MILFLRELFFKDAMLKLFSLILAFLIWFALSYIQREASPVGPVGAYSGQLTTRNVEVMVLSSASDARVYRVDPKTVEVTIEGDPKILPGIQGKHIRAMVDLTGFEPGGDLRKQIEISTPAGVKHVKVSPQEVRVLFPHPR